MSTDLTRRKLCQSVSAVFITLPVLSICSTVHAKTNLPLRDQLKYQDTPKDGMSCTSCVEFSADQKNQSSGTCKVIPGDDEISANGYCNVWNTM